jgi:acetylornithine deacetylase/succinyl-diaminopimelate desuccinylase-like protein
VLLTMSRNVSLALLTAVISLVGTVSAPAETDAQSKQLSHDILKQLIEINTTDSVGSTTAAAQAMAQRLLDAGFPKEDIAVLGPNDRKGNLIARFRGTGQAKPILFIGHLDVVEALRSDWSTDPFQLVEKDGYYYGRGTQDMKEDDAILVTTFIRLKQEGYRPDRDLILALTADEEGGKYNGVDWLLQNHRERITADFVINPDGGGVDLEHGKPVTVEINASEKLYADYQLSATNPGGHSSLPVPDNAIYHIAAAVSHIAAYTFPFELNPTTRAYFERMSTIETGRTADEMKAILRTPPDRDAEVALAKNPEYNASMRTTCVATRLSGGHANNALPQRAEAIVNCRILPGHSPEEIRLELIRLCNDPKVTVRYVDNAGDTFDTAPQGQAFPPQPLKSEVVKPLEKIAGEMWPGAPVLPVMATGASDGILTNAAGMPTYGISGIALERNDVRAHGKDERLPIESYDRGVEFFYRYIKLLSGGADQR